MTSLDRRIQRQETCRQQNRLPSETCLEESFRGLTIGGVVHLTERQYKLNRMTILVGMTGTDGIILAADQCMVRPARSAAEYDDRMDTCKIVHLQKHKVAYAGVGDSVTRDVGRELSAILDSDGFDFGYIAGSLEQVAKDVVNRAKAETEPPDVFDDDRPRSLLIVFYGDQITALSENLTKQPLLRNFLHPLNREELDVGHRHPLGLQQQIPQVLIAPAAVNQHTNVPVHRFHHSE